MILNVSGRTDIVALYTEWFINRYRIGFVDVRNPYNPKLVSRINFSDIDAIMFCTKNPLPIIPYLKEINKPIVFHVTLTPYGKDIEPGIIDKTKVIEGIKEVSKTVGIDNIAVRYDPIFLSKRYNLDYHKKAFEKICTLLEGYVKTIIVSFIDEYKNVRNNKEEIGFREFLPDDYQKLGLSLSTIAKKHSMSVQTCFAEENLVEYGFTKGDCLSHEKAYSLTGKHFKNWSARKGNLCSCVSMVDIGVYNTCTHFCKYCYANYDEKKVKENILKHNPKSSLLIGELEVDDVIKERRY